MGGPFDPAALSGVTWTVLLIAATGFPAAALAFAAHNLRRRPEARLLFLSGVVTSTLSGIAIVLILVLSATAGGAPSLGGWAGIAVIFVYALALLDFWRGARLTGARPRGPAALAALCLAGVLAVFVAVAT